MKIQILADNGFLRLNEPSTLHNELQKLVECEIVNELNYENVDYFLMFDNHDLDYLNEKALAKAILLNIPSPSIRERLSKYKVAGVIESRIYFNNFPFMFGDKNVIDFNTFEDATLNYALESGYISIIKKNREEDYMLANMIIDYLKMHQAYFKKPSL